MIEKKILTTTIEEITDVWGIHKLITQDNGIKVKIMKTPSQAYLDKISARIIREAPAREQERKNDIKRRLIQRQLEEDAIAELKLKGLLDENGDPIE